MWESENAEKIIIAMKRTMMALVCTKIWSQEVLWWSCTRYVFRGPLDFQRVRFRFRSKFHEWSQHFFAAGNKIKNGWKKKHSRCSTSRGCKQSYIEFLMQKVTKNDDLYDIYANLREHLFQWKSMNAINRGNFSQPHEFFKCTDSRVHVLEFSTPNTLKAPRSKTVYFKLYQ